MASCFPYLCADNACLTSCQSADDCDASAYCRLDDGSCELMGEIGDSCADAEQCRSDYCAPSGQCAPDVGCGGLACGTYICDLGACLSSCTSIAQCADGFVCDPSGSCVEPPVVEEGELGCATRGSGGSRSGSSRSAGSLWPLGLLLAVGLWRRRQRA